MDSDYITLDLVATHYALLTGKKLYTFLWRCLHEFSFYSLLRNVEISQQNSSTSFAKICSVSLMRREKQKPHSPNIRLKFNDFAEPASEANIVFETVRRTLYNTVCGKA